MENDKMIRSFEVRGLNGNLDYRLDFNEDLNIITGRNGSGKTSLLKLLWYLLSGNIERTLPEVNFKYAKLCADGFEVEVDAFHGEKEDSVQIRWSIEGLGLDLDPDDEIGQVDLKRLNWESDDGEIDRANIAIVEVSGDSLFFPTFRRIEGGFSSVENRKTNNLRTPNRSNPSIRNALLSYTKAISVNSHRFVTSISTEDIETLLSKEFADISEVTNGLHTQLSKFIINEIDHTDLANEDNDNKKTTAKQHEVLKKIREEVEMINTRRENLLEPFSILSESIKTIFKHKGIMVTKNIVFGETEGAVPSEKLSAGEKQMLSFLCYNVFLRDHVIVIDEPEISLHADWQRLLFPTLLKHSNNNQFIIATHSPMIYSKYPEKEILLTSDRGNELQ